MILFLDAGQFTHGHLTQAYAWRCRQRRDYPPDADLWAFRRRWPEAKAPLRAALLAGEYACSLLMRVTTRQGEDVDLWAARDALVLSARRPRRTALMWPGTAAPRGRCARCGSTCRRIVLW